MSSMMTTWDGNDYNGNENEPEEPTLTPRGQCGFKENPLQRAGFSSVAALFRPCKTFKPRGCMGMFWRWRMGFPHLRPGTGAVMKSIVELDKDHRRRHRALGVKRCGQ
jgi:hypothetical protein